MIQFLWPWAFILLPMPLLVRAGISASDKPAPALPPELEQALNQIHRQQRRPINVQHGLLWLAWIALVSALAQPWRHGESIVQPATGRAIALAVDVSGSMERRDFSIDGLASDRLTIVKQVAGDFVRKRHGDRLSLVLFGRDAFIASPLTFDLQAVGSILDSAGIGMAGRSTAIGDAIGLSIQTLSNDSSSSKAIILLSDGSNNAGAVEPESAARLAHEMSIRIHTIGLGSEAVQRSGYQTSPSADLDEASLQAIAETAGGTYFRAATTEDLQQVYASIDSLERTEAAAPPVLIKQHLHRWPIAIALLAVLCIASRQRLRS